MVLEHNLPNMLVIKLSTGYQVEVDLTKSSRSWLPHLARAIIGERFLEESKAAKEWRFGGVPEELRFLLVTMPPEYKDLLLGQLIYERVMRLYKMLEKRATTAKG